MAERRQVTHVCNKETDIALIKQDVLIIKERLIGMDHKLFGNGQPGIWDTQNKRIDKIEDKMIAWGAVIGVVLILLQIFGTRIVTAVLG